MPPNPAKAYAYKTAVFRIHNPSRRKRAMLSDALTRNHRAYTKLLVALLPNVEEYASFKAGKRRESAIYQHAAPIVRPLPLSIGAKAGLINDVAGQISSYIELRQEQENPSTPTAARLNATQLDYEASLLALASATTLDDENTARDRLFSEVRAGSRRPVLFIENRKKDGFLILYSEQKNDYYVWLNLHSKESRFAHRVKIDNLIDVRTDEVVSFVSRTGAIFPVEFGRDFQCDEFVAKARPQSAKLLERDGEFEVHVTFEFETPKVEPKDVLGVDRGIYNLASLNVVDDRGSVVASKNIDGRWLRHVQRVEERRQRTLQRRGRRYTSSSRLAMANEAVHTAANAIVEMAKQHQAQVVIENLRPMTGRGRKRGRSNFNRVLNRSQYQKLQKVLEYKLPVVGLPRPKTVSAAYTSQTCPCCGHQDRENRPRVPLADGFSIERFICQGCGYEADADLNAAQVIALKKMWRDGLPQSQRTKLMAKLADRYSFKTYLRDRAAMRGDGPGDRKVGTSGGRGLDEAGPHPAEESVGNLALARTHRRTKKSATKLPQLSSSSENPPLPQDDHTARSTGKETIR